MSTIINGTSSAITFPDSTVQNTAGLAAGGTIASGTVTTLTSTTATITTLNAPSGVLATQNGMTGIAKAWVNFDGGNGNTAGTINGSFNVSSITVNGTGDYTVNFTTSMANANYSTFTNTRYSTDGNRTNRVTSMGANYAQTTSASRVICQSDTNDTAYNPYQFYVAIFGA